MPSRKPVCFFLDVCILLPQALSISATSSETFLKKAHESCIISSSVLARTSRMIDYAYDWVAREVQENLYPYLQKQGVNTLTCRNARVFEGFFNKRRKQLKAITSPAMYYEMLGRMEHWTVTEIHTIELGRKINVETFLTALLAELSRVYESLKAPFDAIEVKNIIPKGEIKAQVALQGIQKFEDMEHLASAIQFQFSNNSWVVFVTFDEKHILSHQKRLFEICALHCCKPDYAMDYTRDISREIPPVQYYTNISPKSSQQEGFAKVIESSLGIAVR